MIVKVVWVLFQLQLMNFCCWLKDIEGMTLSSSGSPLVFVFCVFVVTLWVAFVISTITLFFLFCTFMFSVHSTVSIK